MDGAYEKYVKHLSQSNRLEDVNWINLAQNKNQFQPLVITAMFLMVL